MGNHGTVEGKCRSADDYVLWNDRVLVDHSIGGLLILLEFCLAKQEWS